MSISISISAKQDALVIMSNSDLTEGKGYSYPVAITVSPSAAIRLKKKKGVMGCDADVKKCSIFLVQGVWYGPVDIQKPTKEEMAQDKQIETKAKIMEKALTFLTPEEIATLQLPDPV